MTVDGLDAPDQLNADGFRSMIVDGESWEVRRRGDGHYDFEWLSGKADGYGFSIKVNDSRVELSTVSIEKFVRDFMREVNPETGYLD